jgi:predicted outer membrane protein
MFPWEAEVDVRYSTARALGGALIIAGIAACASNQQVVSSSAAGTVDLSRYPAVTLSERELRILRGMSDANVLGHLSMVDSLEVVTADSALRLSKSDAVLAFAKDMRTAHSLSLMQERDIAHRLNSAPTTVVGELRASHIAPSLDSVTTAGDQTIDRHYVTSQVQLHAHVLAELETLRDVARDPAIREHIDAMIPVVRDHLARAHALAIAKGFEAKAPA